MFTSGFYLLQMVDLAFSYFSPWLVDMKRKVYQDYEPWLRQEGNNFYYGYFYAQLLAIFSICVFFSVTIPLVAVSTACFLFLKHWVDCLNLLNVNRKEIDSQGALIDIATNTGLIIIVAYQCCMMAFFSIKELNGEAFICTLMFISSTLYIVLGYENIKPTQSYDQEKKQFD